MIGVKPLKYIKLNDIQKILKHLFLCGKRPKYLRLIPKPDKVLFVLKDQEISQPRKTLYKSLALSEIEEKEYTAFESDLISSGYSLIHLDEHFSVELVFSNLLKDLEIKKINLSLITEKNLELIDKQSILHMFSYTNFIQSKIDFDASIFDSYIKPNKETPYFLLSLDCEMLITDQGRQLGRVSMLDHTGRVVYNKFIRPESKVVDYLTVYSGLNEENTSSGISLSEFRNEITDYIGTNTILLGHGLENDLESMKVYCDNIIDTAYLFLTPDGYKMKLCYLSKVLLNEKIQFKSHDSCEDAFCCLKLLAYKIAQAQCFLDKDQKSIDLGVKAKEISNESQIDERGIYFLTEKDTTVNTSTRKDIYKVYFYSKDNKNYVAFKQH